MASFLPQLELVCRIPKCCLEMRPMHFMANTFTFPLLPLDCISTNCHKFSRCLGQNTLTSSSSSYSRWTIISLICLLATITQPFLAKHRIGNAIVSCSLFNVWIKIPRLYYFEQNYTDCIDLGHKV